MNSTPMSWMRRPAAQPTPWAVTSTCFPKTIGNGLPSDGSRRVQALSAALFRAIPLRCCRADLVIRRALL